MLHNTRRADPRPRGRAGRATDDLSGEISYQAGGPIIRHVAAPRPGGRAATPEPPPAGDTPTPARPPGRNAGRGAARRGQRRRRALFLPGTAIGDGSFATVPLTARHNTQQTTETTFECSFSFFQVEYWLFAVEYNRLTRQT